MGFAACICGLHGTMAGRVAGFAELGSEIAMNDTQCLRPDEDHQNQRRSEAQQPTLSFRAHIETLTLYSCSARRNCEFAISSDLYLGCRTRHSLRDHIGNGNRSARPFSYPLGMRACSPQGELWLTRSSRGIEVGIAWNVLVPISGCFFRCVAGLHLIG